MSAKMSPQRRAAFLKALAETGNQIIAAERAKVSRSWVQLHRSADPQFRAEVAATVAEARARFLAERKGGSMAPPKGWGHLDGEELVVRGSNGRRVQVARARLRQWTPRVEARFLKLLEQTCNLRLSLRAVGLSGSSLHAHRKRWPAFDERCERAIALGYERIDGGLAAGAIRLLDPEVIAKDPDPAIAPMSVDDAIRLVRLHERRAWEAARGVGPGGRVRERRAPRADCKARDANLGPPFPYKGRPL
jgi:hypothetical protein